MEAHLEAVFGERDFAVLETLAQQDAPPPLDSPLAHGAQRAHDNGRQLLQRGADAAGRPELHLSVWPWRSDEELFPFVWGRYKLESARPWAAHIGVFLSPGGCNCALDLEKDPLDAGEANESLSEVLAFYRDRRSDLFSDLDDRHLGVWTDDVNVVGVEDFLVADFDRFMGAHRDAGHPWPRIGYRFAPDDPRFTPERQVASLGAWLDRLLPLYEELLAHCGHPR